MVTPGRMIAPPPIQTLRPMWIGRPNSNPEALPAASRGLDGCESNPEVSLSRRSQRYAQVIDITHVHLGAGAAVVQAFFFCASNHSIEPGWGTG
jgi:hypothetical protein